MNKREFELACSVLPPDFCWGEPVTPELVLHIIGAATPSAQSSQQGAVALPDFPDPVLCAIRDRAAHNVDDWSERQEIEPSPEVCDARFVREIVRLLSIQVPSVFTHPASPDSLRRENEALRQELKNIANADTAEWDDRSEFEEWAKSRARHALSQQPAPGGEG